MANVQLTNPLPQNNSTGGSGAAPIAPVAAPSITDRLLGGSAVVPSAPVVANSTPATVAPGSINSALQLLNPLRATSPIRPAFGLPSDAKSLPFGGPVLGLAVDTASRVLEAIPAALTLGISAARNINQSLKGEQQSPFDTLIDPSRLGLTSEQGTHELADPLTRYQAIYDKNAAATPNEHALNLVRTAVEGPISDSLTLLVAGGIGKDAAEAALRATAFDPGVKEAVQKLGLDPKTITLDNLKSTFVKKAQMLVDNEDWNGLNDLGAQTNTLVHAINGEGVPALSRLGQIIQDTARKALSIDAPGSFAEIAPETPVQGLPGTRPVGGQPSPKFALGLSTERVERVGGAADDGAPRDAYGDVVPDGFVKSDAKYQAKQSSRAEVQRVIEEGATAPAVGDKIQFADGTSLKIVSIQPSVVGASKGMRDITVQAAGGLAHTITEVQSPLSTGSAQGRTTNIVSPSAENGVVPSTPEEAAKTYWDAKIAPAAAEGKAVVIGGDDLKDFFGGDYNDANHPIYSQAAFQMYERALKENKGDTVVFTGGGPGSGKSEILVKDLQAKGFNGIIYDSNLSNYDGAVKQIEMARAAGKDVVVSGILPNLHTARVHTILREQRTGRGISDKTFARGHSQFPAVVAKLIHNGILKPEDVRLLDLRSPTTLEEAKAKAQSGGFEKQPLALLSATQYNEEALRGKYGREKYTTAAGKVRPPNSRGVAAKSRALARDGQAPDSKRANQAAAGARELEPGGAGPVPDGVLRGAQEAADPELESYQALADTARSTDFFLQPSQREEEKLVDNLSAIFADLKGIDLKDLSQKFTQEDLDNAKAHYEYTMDALLDHPGRALAKYVSRETGALPEFGATKTANGNKSTSIFAQKGEDILIDALGYEGSGGADIERGQEMVDAYHDLRKNVAEIQNNLRNVRKTIRLQKMRDNFVEKSRHTLARQVAKDVAALKSLVQSAERAGIRKGTASGKKLVADMYKKIRSRRVGIRIVQERYNLSDGEMRKIAGQDPRFMDDEEYATYLRTLEEKAALENQKNLTRLYITDQIDTKELRNPENLRVALELPTLNNMTLEQLQEYETALSQFQQKDAFLGPRMIQTLGNTDLGELKTVREIRASLAKQAGVDLSTLDDVRGTWDDKFTYDAALANANPLYKYMVHEFVAKDVENAQIIQEIRHKIDTLAKAARKSRKLGLFDRLVPQDKIVFDWLETKTDEKQLFEQARGMTPAEIEYAKFVEALYRKWRDILIEKGALKKWRENYITHITQSFFEQWKEDGLVRAVGRAIKGMGDSYTDFDAVGDTGEVLGLEKFFKFSLPRSGVIAPSKNVARVVMSYASTFYKKQALDAILPKIDAYTFSLQREPKEGVPKDPTGVGVDGKLRRFVRQWLNNKKGRHIEAFVDQGGKLDNTLRALKLFVSLKYLGLNIVSQIANTGGAIHANFTGLTTGNFVKGAARLLTPSGRKLMVKYPGVVGHAPYESIIGAANDIGDTLTSGIFIIMQKLMYEAKAQYFLGSLTPDELKSGIVSTSRQADIKLDMARFHPIEGMESLAGSTTEGKVGTQFKTWAVPYLFTAVHNMRMIARIVAKDGAGAAAKSKEVRELFKIFVGALGAYLFFNMIFGKDSSDSSFTSNLKQRLSQDLASGLSSIDPATWATAPPAVSFVEQFGMAVRALALMETYTTTSKSAGTTKGELKAPVQLEKLLTPGIIKQFTPAGAPLDLLTNSKTKRKGTVQLTHP